MEQEEDKKSKKLNDDTVIYLQKRSETETPRYAARLRAYVDLHRKRSRAAAARRRSEHGERKASGTRKKGESEQEKKNLENSLNTPNAARKSNCGLSGEHPGAEDDRMSRRRGGDKAGLGRTRSRSAEPSDRCGRRRRRKRRSCSRRRRKRRRRSCRRKKRRRRSCRRRRRRSRSRRRRRRSCRRRRKRRRRC